MQTTAGSKYFGMKVTMNIALPIAIDFVRDIWVVIKGTDFAKMSQLSLLKTEYCEKITTETRQEKWYS